MKQWLIMFLTNWLTGIKARNQPVEPETPEVVEEEFGNCPICGEEWEEKAIFCCICGYELKDEELALHPPPQRTGALTDPDNVLPEGDTVQLKEKYGEIGRKKGWDIAVLILPEALRNRNSSQDQDKEENLGGLLWCLYNTWGVGKNTNNKGLLFALDPSSTDRFLVTGLNNPRISGEVFRKWYGERELSERMNQGSGTGSVVIELDHIAEKIGKL